MEARPVHGRKQGSYAATQEWQSPLGSINGAKSHIQASEKEERIASGYYNPGTNARGWAYGYWAWKTKGGKNEREEYG